MAQLPTPPASRHSSEAPEAKLKQLHIDDSPSGLLISLDAMLERYLNLLDKHQELQGELASKLSSGFLSLAQANYTCPPGRRYGSDYYDERMKATSRIVLQPPHSLNIGNRTAESAHPSEKPAQSTTPKHIFTVESIKNTQEEAKSVTRGQVEEHSFGGKDVKDKHSNTEYSSSAESTAPSQDSLTPSTLVPKKTPDPAKKKTRSSDPIRWYGVLVPPSLRSAQKSFTEGVEDCLPELASVVVEMQIVEKEITRLRKDLGQE